AICRIGQPLCRLVQKRGISGRTKPIASHELRISQRILAISWPRARHRCPQRSVQCPGDVSCDLVLHFEEAVDMEVALPREAWALQMRVEQFHRETRLPFRYLN